MHSDGHGVGDGGDGWRQAISSPRMCWSAWTATSSSLTLGWPRRTSQKPTNRGRSVGLLCASLCGIVLLEGAPVRAWSPGTSPDRHLLRPPPPPPVVCVMCGQVPRPGGNPQHEDQGRLLLRGGLVDARGPAHRDAERQPTLHRLQHPAAPAGTHTPPSSAHPATTTTAHRRHPCAPHAT
jgi:hypothetical protein